MCRWARWEGTLCCSGDDELPPAVALAQLSTSTPGGLSLVLPTVPEVVLPARAVLAACPAAWKGCRRTCSMLRRRKAWSSNRGSRKLNLQIKAVLQHDVSYNTCTELICNYQCWCRCIENTQGSVCWASNECLAWAVGYSDGGQQLSSMLAPQQVCCTACADLPWWAWWLLQADGSDAGTSSRCQVAMLSKRSPCRTHVSTNQAGSYHAACMQAAGRPWKNLHVQRHTRTQDLQQQL